MLVSKICQHDTLALSFSRSYWIVLIVSLRVFGWPLSRALAKIIHPSQTWLFDDRKVDRAVLKSQSATASAHHWWSQKISQEPGRTGSIVGQIMNALSSQKISPQDLQSVHQISRKIYILGIGNIGTFVAHSLAGIPNRPPITLLLRPRQHRYWEESDRSIDVTSNGVTERRRGFEVEQLRRLQEDSPSLGREYSAVSKNPSNETAQKGRAMRSIVEKGGDTRGITRSLNGGSSLADSELLQTSYNHKFSLDEKMLDRDITPQYEQEANDCFAHVNTTAEEAKHKQEHNPDPVFGRDTEDDKETIYHLIVSVKAPQTVKAIQAIAHRLTPASSLLFLQNGMGIMDQVNEHLFPDENRRPTYIIGVVSHGLYSKGPFSVVHAGEGSIALGVMPRMSTHESLRQENLSELTTSARYLIRTMTRTSVFVAVGFPPTEILQQQLDKLAVNCIINPLTAIFDCKNGALLSNFHLIRVIRLLLAELSLVIKSLPELQNVPNVNTRFDSLRLERLVVSICKGTASNNSSMLQDIKQDKQTEIDYINGYVIRRGEEMGIHCVMNYMLLHMVKGKRKIESLEQANLLPLAELDKE